MYSNLKDVITAAHATDVFLTWTITVHGLTIALAFGTGNTLCFF
jgi:hypothetical protein